MNFIECDSSIFVFAGEVVFDEVAMKSRSADVLGKLGGWLKAPLKARALSLASHQASEDRFNQDVRLQILEQVRERLQTLDPPALAH